MRQASCQSKLRVRIERGIYKRQTRHGETRYEVAYTDSNGKQRWRTVERLQEARDLRADLVSKVNRGERVVPSKVPLQEYVESWLADEQGRLKKTTLDRYRCSLENHVYPRLGRRRLGDITVNDVARLVGGMEKGIRFVERDGTTVQETGKPFAAWTSRGVLVALGRVLGSAERDGLISSNPVRKLERRERPKVQRTTFPDLDKAAIGSLIEHAPQRYKVLIAVSLLTGIRQGEALGLQWQDVDTTTGTISIRRQLDRQANSVSLKTNAARRDIPIPPSLARMLTIHKEEAFARGCAKPGDFVFGSETGGPMHYRNIVRRGLEKAVTAAVLPHLRWHDLRHLAASMLISDGAPASYVANMLGHSTPAITLSIYAHQFAKAEHADRTRERMEEAFAEVLR
jgi:integrase